MRGLRGQGAFVLLLAYATAAPVLAIAAGVWFLPSIVALFDHAAAWAVPLFVVVTAGPLALAVMPATAMAILAGALFGLPGLVPAVASYLLACLAVFEAVRRSFQDGVQAAVRRSPRLVAIQAELEQATLRIVILSRLSVVLPFALMNVLLSVSPVTRRTYLWGSLAGMLPRTLVAVAAGTAAEAALTALRAGRVPTAAEANLGSALGLLAIAGTVGLAWYLGKALWKVFLNPLAPGDTRAAARTAVSRARRKR
ncbi:MAG: TVP38/TMEM64 family protein [Candidatus Rokuibacteriota bacterium]